MTKENIVNQISTKTGVDRSTALSVVEAFMGSVKDNVGRGERIEIRGFGVFSIVQRKAKIGRNLYSGATVFIPAQPKVKFVPSKFFRIVQE